MSLRFGFAYRLPQNWGVVRGAYGLHYGEIFPVTYAPIRFSPPRSVKLTIPAPAEPGSVLGTPEFGCITASVSE